MTMLLAIDPGNIESAFLLYDKEAKSPVVWKKAFNFDVLACLNDFKADALAIEMIASYGMPVGSEVFDTCVWIGRFIERWTGPVPLMIPRKHVGLHLCQSSRAKDATVRQALIDRYGPGKEVAIGRKASPGPLYGMSGDCWAALGVAITAAEDRESTQAEAFAHIKSIREEHHLA